MPVPSPSRCPWRTSIPRSIEAMRRAVMRSGIYLVRYRIDGFTKQQKLVLLR